MHPLASAPLFSQDLKPSTRHRRRHRPSPTRYATITPPTTHRRYTKHITTHPFVTRIVVVRVPHPHPRRESPSPPLACAPHREKSPDDHEGCAPASFPTTANATRPFRDAHTIHKKNPNVPFLLDISPTRCAPSEEEADNAAYMTWCSEECVRASVQPRVFARGRKREALLVMRGTRAFVSMIDARFRIVNSDGRMCNKNGIIIFIV